ncbi:hypothetical protein CO018_04150 [Candidatus Beckwithbacteria bacterium CG_4_9_14_0_2_um_filter_47_11]|uniref:Uncharacterized protein n=2 Tax=Candidatus Beckwithiibacteriota TaxID=1752726 RepID=A0A2M8G314_9BACT|nr:MAG: hypothetical protein CO018_04150 [Candidatus Beckwithbacteria bacterium CG_4_9_14_0_2_um_filter_47_11]
MEKLGYHFAEDDTWLFLPKNKQLAVFNQLRAERVTNKKLAQIYVEQVHDPVFAEWGTSDLSGWIDSYFQGPNEHEYTYLYYFKD